MDRWSSVNCGPTHQIDLLLSNKQNQGFAEDNGDMSFASVPLSIVNDSHFSDTNAGKTSIIKRK
jgi:hypothetical protein